MSGLRVGVDIGGTKTALALVDDSGLRSEVVTVPTRTESGDELVRAAAEAIGSVVASADADVEGVGIGVAGLVTQDARHVRFAPHLPLADHDTAAEFEVATGRRVVLENDATAAAWGEYRLGAGRGRSSMLMVSVGTGVGGGIVVDGELLRGASGTAAEIGHVPFVADGVLCGCGARGCWEQYASGSALGRMAREAATVDPKEAAVILSAAGGEAASITGAHVAIALAAGDALAGALVAELGRVLGEGIAGLVAVLDPEVVVVGGGVAELGDALLEPARQVFGERVVGAAHRPAVPLVPAELGPDAALIGAALLPLAP